MLTIEELPLHIKDRIITILTVNRTDRNSLISCVMGLAWANLGCMEQAERLKNIKNIAANAEQNKREYVRQALTIFGTYAAAAMLDEVQLEFGEVPESKIQEMKLAGEQIVTKAVEDHLEHLVKTVDILK